MILNGLVLLASYISDLTLSLRAALISWWDDAFTASYGLAKIVLIDIPLAIWLIHWQPFVCVGAVSAWLSFSRRRPRPIEGAIVGIASLSLGIWLLNVAAEVVLVLTALAIWDGRKHLLQSWWSKNVDAGIDPNSYGNRVLLALS